MADDAAERGGQGAGCADEYVSVAAVCVVADAFWDSALCLRHWFLCGARGAGAAGVDVDPEPGESDDGDAAAGFAGAAVTVAAGGGDGVDGAVVRAAAARDVSGGNLDASKPGD